MRKPGVLIIGGVVIAALTASIAIAAGGASPDGGPPSGTSRDVQSRATSTLTCGRPLSSVVKRESDASTTNSEAFEDLPGAVVSITVPEGTTRCVKVLFTAEAACFGTGGDFCYVRAVRNGDVLQPDAGGTHAFQSNAPSAGAHAAQWSRRLPAGTYRIALQWSVIDSSTTFSVDDWSFDVEVTG